MKASNPIPEGSVRRHGGDSQSKASLKASASHLLGRGSGPVFVFPSYSLRIPFVFSWYSLRILLLFSAGAFRHVKVSSPSSWLVLTALVCLLLEANLGARYSLLTRR